MANICFCFVSSAYERGLEVGEPLREGFGSCRGEGPEWGASCLWWTRKAFATKVEGPIYQSIVSTQEIFIRTIGEVVGVRLFVISPMDKQRIFSDFLLSDFELREDVIEGHKKSFTDQGFVGRLYCVQVCGIYRLRLIGQAFRE